MDLSAFRPQGHRWGPQRLRRGGRTRRERPEHPPKRASPRLCPGFSSGGDPLPGVPAAMNALAAGLPLVSIVTFLPLAGSILLVFIRSGSVKTVRTIALAVSLLTFVLS